MNSDPVVEVEGGLVVRMTVSFGGEVLAESSAVDDTGRLRLPPGWLEQDRGVRDEDLDWWWSEVATVWLDGVWERFPVPAPKQGALL